MFDRRALSAVALASCAPLALACGGDGGAANPGGAGGAGAGDASSTRASGQGTSTGHGTGGGAPTSTSTTTSSASTGAGGALPGRGFPVGAPWVSFYGGVQHLDLGTLASSFRIINLDADPDGGNITNAQIVTLQANGQNKVISYLDVGSCENFRSYYDHAPAGHASCVSSGALTTIYDGYPDEKWADLSNAAYQDLLVNYVAQRLADRGVDGFFLDNLEVVEHGPNTNNGPCNAACSQGGLDLVHQLRQRFPDKLIVMQNATSDTTRLGTTNGVAYPSLLDGISHEEVFSHGGDAQAQHQLLAWQAMNLAVNGSPFWIGAEDYVGACSAQDKSAADAIYAEDASDGFSGYVTDDSGMQLAPCYWSDF